MTAASAMAEPSDVGAPIAKDAIDPELIKLARTKAKIGLVTAAGLVFLCALYLVRLSPDRRFAGAGDEPARATVADVVAGNVGADRFIEIAGAEPLISHAIRATTAKGSLGSRLVPVRGTGDKLWIAMSGDGWDPPAGGTYRGRLRELDRLPYAASVSAYAADHPRPVFAQVAAVRAALAGGELKGVAGDSIATADGDQVAYDVVDPDEAIVVGTLGDRYPNAAAWQTALTAAGVALAPSDGAEPDPSQPDVTIQSARFRARGSVAALTDQLAKAMLYAARVEPRTIHHATTWGALRADPKALANVDLVGVYVAHPIPSGAYVLLTEERPADYWYVLPITIALALVALVFAWALVRAVKRDLLPSRA